MIAISNTMNSALYLLRQGGAEFGAMSAGVDAVVSIVNAKAAPVRVPEPLAAPPGSKTSMPPEPVPPPLGWSPVVENAYLSDEQSSPPAGCGDSATRPESAPELEKVLSREDAVKLIREYRKKADEEYKAGVEAILADPANRPDSAETQKAIWQVRNKTDVDFAKRTEPLSKIFWKEPELTPWEKEQKAAFHSAALLIGYVMLANAKFHKLEIGAEGPTHYDQFDKAFVEDHNSHLEQYSMSGYMNLEFAVRRANVGNVVSQKDSGEYKVGAFQQFSHDGKLISELTDKGEFIQYSEDGSVFRTRSRAQTSAMPSEIDTIEHGARYGRYTASHPELYENTEFF